MGPGARILFLHGGGLNAQQWAEVRRRLPQFEVLTPDLPGHGLRAGEPLTLSRAVEVAREALGGQPAHVVGHSLGGTVALTLAARHPGEVLSLLLSGSTGPLTPGQARPMRRAAHWPLPTHLALTLALWQFRVPLAERAWVREALAATLSPGWQEALIEALLAASSPAPLSTRTLLLVGQRETWAARSGTVALARALGGAPARQVPGVGHVWNLEDPGLFAQVVRAWVMGELLPDGLARLAYSIGQKKMLVLSERSE